MKAVKDEASTLENYVKNMRIKKGVTQDELGSKIGHLNGQAISNWEKGKATIPAKHFKIISKVLGVSVEVLKDRRVEDMRRDLESQVG